MDRLAILPTSGRVASGPGRIAIVEVSGQVARGWGSSRPADFRAASLLDAELVQIEYVEVLDLYRLTYRDDGFPMVPEGGPIPLLPGRLPAG